MSVFGTGSNLPPGCSVRDIERSAGYGDEGPYFLKCSKCGRFLRLSPDRVEQWEHKMQCGGWPLAADDLSLWEPACGNSKKHDPHEFVEDCGSYAVRICSHCGCENNEV